MRDSKTSSDKSLTDHAFDRVSWRGAVRGLPRIATRSGGLIACATAAFFIATTPANADFVFTGSSSGGTFDYDNDGVADGTWTMTNSGQITETVTFPTVGGVSFFYTGSGDWDLTSNFNAIPSDPDVTYSLSLYGNSLTSLDKKNFGSAFEDYTISWAGVAGTAVVDDPDTELTGVVTTPNSVNWQQVLSGSSGTGCNRPTGAINNDCLDWSVELPQGAGGLTLSATGGATDEGFRFGLISYADISVTKGVSETTFSEGSTGSYTIEVSNIGTPGQSAAVGTTIIDPLPAGVTYTTHVISSNGPNPGGTYNDTTGEWTVGKVGLNETITLSVNFTVDAGTAGTTITNTINPSDIQMAQTDPVANHGTLSATFNATAAAPMVEATDDTPTSVDGVTGATIPNVVANDTLNGTPNPTIGTDVTVAATGTAQDGTTVLGLDVTPTAGGITLDPDTGIITVAAGTPGGTYVYTYEICDVANAAICDTAEVTVVVDDGVPPVATNDSVTPTNPGPVTIDPLANDSGDDPLDPTSVVLTGTGAPTSSTLSADGKTLTVLGEGEWTVNPTTGLVTFTPEAGFSGSPTPAAYTVSDVMGRVSNEAVLGVTILAPVEITATNDGPIALDGSNGDTSSVSVLSNDTLDGSPITDPSLITLTTVSGPTGVTLNPDGTVTVAPGTTSGTYTVVYEICETANPTNCASAEVEVIVVDTGEGLINEIEDDLVSILEEDLANILTQQSNQISGYSADALDRLRDRGQGQGSDQCMVAVNLHAKNILFNVDSAVILPDYFKPVRYETLDRIAAILAGCPGIAFEIAGHTDSDASDAYNIDLSQRRVNAVLQALAARGVDTSGYIARGYGESQPIATNATAAGKAQNRRVEFRVLDGIENTYQGPCDDSFSLVRNFNLNADENGVNADGNFVRDQHDCITDRREVYEGTLSYLDTETGQTQSAINLSYRREQYRGSDSVFGYFAGLYGSKSEVTRLANGEINGLGVNAGIYGANRVHNELFVDYYLGAAAGRHSFDLAFERDIGTIDATGEYQYLAGFAGAALSGEVELGDTTLTPRIGFDYVYTPGADVDVVAELSGLSETGNLELDAISGGRVFGEVRFDHVTDDGTANMWFNPRVACYQSLGALDGACGVGGSIGIESVEQDSGFTYGAELDGEWGENYTQGSLSLRASRDLDVGTLSGDAGVTRNGNATLGGTYEIEF